MYTSASATGSTSSVSIVPGPVLSKSVRKELLPVSTRPPPAFPWLGSGLRSEGNALVIELDGPASALSFRRRRKRKAPAPRMPAIASPPMPRYIGLSIASSMKLFSTTGAGFLGGVAGLGGALEASATFGGSAGFAGSAGFGASVLASLFGGSTGAGVGFGGS